VKRRASDDGQDLAIPAIAVRAPGKTCSGLTVTGEALDRGQANPR